MLFTTNKAPSNNTFFILFKKSRMQHNHKMHLCVSNIRTTDYLKCFILQNFFSSALLNTKTIPRSIFLFVVRRRVRLSVLPGEWPRTGSRRQTHGVLHLVNGRVSIPWPIRSTTEQLSWPWRCRHLEPVYRKHKWIHSGTPFEKSFGVII